MVNNVGEFMLVESAHVVEFVEVLFYPFFANSLSYITIPQTRKNMI